MSGSGSHRTGQRQRHRACIDTGHIWWPKDRQWNRCESCGALERRPNDEPCMCGTPFTCLADEHPGFGEDAP